MYWDDSRHLPPSSTPSAGVARGQHHLPCLRASLRRTTFEKATINSHSRQGHRQDRRWELEFTMNGAAAAQRYFSSVLETTDAGHLNLSHSNSRETCRAFKCAQRAAVRTEFGDKFKLVVISCRRRDGSATANAVFHDGALRSFARLTRAALGGYGFTPHMRFRGLHLRQHTTPCSPCRWSGPL